MLIGLQGSGIQIELLYKLYKWSFFFVRQKILRLHVCIFSLYAQGKYINKRDKFLAFQNVARDVLLARTKMDLKHQVLGYESTHRTNKIEQMDLGDGTWRHLLGLWHWRNMYFLKVHISVSEGLEATGLTHILWFINFTC